MRLLRWHCHRCSSPWASTTADVTACPFCGDRDICRMPNRRSIGPRASIGFALQKAKIGPRDADTPGGPAQEVEAPMHSKQYPASSGGAQ